MQRVTVSQMSLAHEQQKEHCISRLQGDRSQLVDKEKTPNRETEREGERLPATCTLVFLLRQHCKGYNTLGYSATVKALAR